MVIDKIETRYLIGDDLREYMYENDIKVYEAANRIPCHWTMVSRIINKRVYPSRRLTYKIERFMGIKE